MRPAGRLFFSVEGDIKAIHRFDADALDTPPEVFITQAMGDPTSDQVEDSETDSYADVVYPFEEEDRNAATVLITAIMSEVYHSVMGMSPETISATVELHIAAYQLMGLDMLNQVFYEVMHPSDEGDSNGNSQESSNEKDGGESPGEESSGETDPGEESSGETDPGEESSGESPGENLGEEMGHADSGETGGDSVSREGGG